MVARIGISFSLSAQEFKPHSEQDLTDPAVKVTLNDKGDFKEVIVLQWYDSAGIKEGHLTTPFNKVLITSGNISLG